jgi:ABC-type transport system involved in multi-copper enzyme maturation permease subunit
MESLTLPAPMDAPSTSASKAWLVASAALRVAIRDRTVVWLTAMFLAMVLVSAYLGWAATHTLDGIFQKAVPVLKALGRDIPVNPALEVSPLSDLRNMTTYVSLLGALAAIVLGTQLIGADRKSGVLSLIVSRPVSRTAYALGKILALIIAVVALLAVTAAVNALTMLLLPGQTLTPSDWQHLLAFYGVSALCLIAFGLIAMYFAVVARSESLALLIPVTIWLAMTFVLPQLTSNTNPMNALNPIKATVVPTTGSFFDVTATLLGPLSLMDIYRSLAATILGFTPGVHLPQSTTSGVLIYLGVILMVIYAIVRAVRNFDASRSDYND